MTKDDIQLLFEYDRWANRRILQACTALSMEQFTRDLKGSFPSLRDTILHIIAGEWIWLAYWKAPTRDDALLAELRKQREVLFNPACFPDVSSVQQKCSEVEDAMADFVASLTEETLNELLPARGTRLRLANLMQHVANHSTYHRGQATLMIRQLEGEPIATDFHVFVAESHREAQSR